MEGGLDCRGLHTVGILTGGGSEKSVKVPLPAKTTGDCFIGTLQRL